MSEYYCFPTQPDAQTCLDYINGSDWFPVVGRKDGQPAPESQATTRWAEAPRELITGEWAVPRIPESRLDYLGVPQTDRAAFLAAFGQDIRALDRSDFVQPETP